MEACAGGVTKVMLLQWTLLFLVFAASLGGYFVSLSYDMYGGISTTHIEK